MRLLKFVTVSGGGATRCASTSSAVQLSFARYGNDSDRQTNPLIIAHGLFGQKNNWNSVAKALQRKLGNQAMKGANVESRKFNNIAEARKTIDNELKPVVKEMSVRQFLLTNLYPKSDDTIAWRLNLDTLRDYIDEVIGFSVVKDIAASTYNGPTLFLSGGNSPYVTEADHPEIKKFFPNVTYDVIPAAGHWLHAEKPKDFIDSVHKFLR